MSSSQRRLSSRCGDDLALSRATDFYSLDELLSETNAPSATGYGSGATPRSRRSPPDYWEAARFPVELVKGYGALGIAGGSLVGDGCPGLSFLAEGMIAAELASGDGSIATLNAVHSGLAMTTIGMLGSAEQRAQYLPRMAACDVLGAFALTEPKHGSDVVALETRAHRDGDEWVLDGEKRWIGNGTVAGIVVVWARDDDGNVGAFVVEHPGRRRSPGSRLPRPQDRRQGREPRGLAGADQARRGSGPGRVPGWPRRTVGMTPTSCWPSPGRPSPGKRSDMPSPRTRPR